MRRTSTGYQISEINHDYFNINNLKNHPERAVVIGFIAADGCINIPAKGQPTLVVRLGKKDKRTLEILNQEISNNQRPIWEDKNSFCISFPSNQICSDLSQFGIVPRKTQILSFPDLTEPLMKYFIRGYFYGDGCVYKNKKVSKYHFVGNTDFINQLKHYIQTNTNVELVRTYLIKRNPIYSNLEISGRQASIFAEYLFFDDNMILIPRKHIKLKLKTLKATWWTDEENQKLIACKSFEEIRKLSQDLGRSYESARTRRNRLLKFNL